MPAAIDFPFVIMQDGSPYIIKTLIIPATVLAFRSLEDARAFCERRDPKPYYIAELIHKE